MITTARVDDTTIEDGIRSVKVEQFGAKTANESMPFGIDSVPLRNTIAIYAETSECGEPVIIGYINEDQVAEIGEIRLFSLDASGAQKTYVHLKNNGNIELGGNERNLVAFQQLSGVLNKLVADINTELGKVAVATGGAYVPAPITLDMLTAKVEDVFVK